MNAIRFTSVTALVAVLAACSTTQQSSNDESIIVTGSQAGDRSSENAPPPPPPPPPPAPQMAQMAGPVTAVTSSRNSQGAAEKSGPPQTVAAADATSYRYIVPPVVVPADPGREQYDGEEVSPVKLARSEPVSTFSVDVDTASYANMRRFLTDGQTPPKAAVRTEEFINYFRYDYDTPDRADQPFSVNLDTAVTPWNSATHLVRIGLAGYELPKQDRPPANLVFLLDVSGSMGSADKLPLVKTAMRQLANQLQDQDRVSIVVYAGAAGLVLEPTNDPVAIRSAMDDLRAGGSTAGGAGIELAYRIAEANRIEGGVNRVILATDGDFNVGVSSREALIEMIEKKRESGTTLSVLGFGTGNTNDAMMEQVADNGNGNYSYIDSALEAKKVLGEEVGGTIFTIAKDVKIQVEFNPAVISQYRLIGYENRILREEDFNNDAVDAGDIGAGHQVTALYEVVPVDGQGWILGRRYDDPIAQTALDRSAEAAYIKLRYKKPDGDTSILIQKILPASALATTAMPTGDFAFATSVAALGQKLRKDPKLDSYSYRSIERLAGSQSNYYRQEFIKLVGLAGGMSVRETGE